MFEVRTSMAVGGASADTAPRDGSRLWKGNHDHGVAVPPPTYFAPQPGSSIESKEVFAPVHDFVGGQRQSLFLHSDEPDAKLPRPPRVYVDQTSLIREVSDVTALRRGDHCMITLNALRCVHPRLDYFVSLLGSLEIVNVYHHFTVLDDVAGLDENGVPRTSSGEIVGIMEYSNTLPQFWEEARVMSLGKWWLFCITAVKMLLLEGKAKCQLRPLADYGDMPHIFRFERKMDDAEREQIRKNAVRLAEQPPKYNMIFSNCEHTTNLVHNREWQSPEVWSVCWTMTRTILTVVALVILHVALTSSYPAWALVIYYTLTVVPIVLQSIIWFVRVALSVRRCYLQNMISQVDLYHLLTKEFCRAVITCGTAVAVIVFAPWAAWSLCERCIAMMTLAVPFAYMGSDMLYGLTCQLVVRMFLKRFGRFWLLGGSTLTREEESKAAAATNAKKVC